ncbi:MAG: hypothetical protein ABEJ22_06990 [Haloferacaceae archaeon]
MTTSETEFDLADRIAMYLGGGLLLLAIPVMGVLNILAGAESPMYAYEVTQGGETTTGHALTRALAPDGATIVHSPLFAPNLRAYIAALGLIIVGAYFVYRLFVTSPREAQTRQAAPTAD